MSFDKTFFVEMMTNGIPVKENIDLAAVFKLVDEQSEICDYKVIIIGEELGILDKKDNICTSLKMLEDIKGDYRLVFFTPIDQDQLLEIAHSVGAVLMVTISACARENVLDISKIPRPDLLEAPTGKEESTEFESDFI